MATNTYVALNTQTLVSNGTVTFSSISQTYTDLVLVVNNAQSTASTPGVSIRFNSDTGSNYSATYLEGTGSAASSSRLSNQSYIVSGNAIGLSTSNPALVIFQIQNYSNTTTYKSALIRYAQTNGAAPGVSASVGLWRNTAAITDININAQGGNLTTGTVVSLYGIRAEGTSPAPKATGGAIYSDSTYYYHVFGSTGTFTPLQSLTADYVVVAGGGGGGGTTGGGGGAGGFYSTTSASLTATGYTVTIGAGGAGGTNNGSSGSAGTQGTNTSFNSITRTGGGGGSTSPNSPTYPATTGGSGGGGSRSGSSQPGAAGNAGSYSPVEGYAGGDNYRLGGVYGTGGGGGAGGVGQAGTSTYDGAGGIGATSALITSIVNASGVGQLVSSTGYIAGGGGGASGDSASTTPTGASGGNGGGGKGGSGTTYAVSGQAGTGSGGGGSAYFGGYLSGANGGSGVVVIRYAK
jgi:hypothetical protein